MRRPVKMNDGSVPAGEILCTTYQMRNFYRQLGDGFFTNLDVMNYIQHLAAVRMIRKGDQVLDVCCGRGLLLPLMRYHASDAGGYTGVDIEEGNLESRHRNVATGKEVDPEEHYPFPVRWIVCDVANMHGKLKGPFDLIVYTSAIEHMHKEHGERSLAACAALARSGAMLFLSCPNTPEGQDGHKVRYRAHVYEWKLSELEKALALHGWKVERLVGLVGNVRELRGHLVRTGRVKEAAFVDGMASYLPREFASAVVFADYPEVATEVLVVARRT